jgi:hypothetical protein
MPAALMVAASYTRIMSAAALCTSAKWGIDAATEAASSQESNAIRVGTRVLRTTNVPRANTWIQDDNAAAVADPVQGVMIASS